MALTFKLFLLIVLLEWNVDTKVMARSLDPSSSLVARLKLDGSSKCWDSLIELQACSSEVIMFFLNGETYLGPGCCEAIRIIEHHCWPAMLGVLGFTPEEGDILQGYCDAEASSSETTSSTGSTEVNLAKALSP